MCDSLKTYNYRGKTPPIWPNPRSTTTKTFNCWMKPLPNERRTWKGEESPQFFSSLILSLICFLRLSRLFHLLRLFLLLCLPLFLRRFRFITNYRKRNFTREKRNLIKISFFYSSFYFIFSYLAIHIVVDVVTGLCNCCCCC